MELLEPYIDGNLNVAFKADNEQYWSRIGSKEIWSSKDTKDAYTAFKVEKIPSDLTCVYLKCVSNGKYLSRDGAYYICANKSIADQYCVMEVYESNGKVVFKNRSCGKFLTRWCPTHIFARKDGADKYTQFIVEPASLTPVKEEIKNLVWGVMSDARIERPSVLDTKEVVNKGSQPLEFDVALERNLTTTSETMWESGWSVTTGIKVKTQIFSAEFTASLTAEWNGKKGGTNSRSTTTIIRESTKVTVPPNKKVVAKLFVTLLDNAEVPFTATIERTSFTGTNTITVRGKWKGVIAFNSRIVITEEDL